MFLGLPVLIQNTVGDQKLENRLGMPGNKARCTVPDGGGGNEARCTAPDGGGGNEARCTAPDGGGRNEARCTAPDEGGGTRLGVPHRMCQVTGPTESHQAQLSCSISSCFPAANPSW